MKKIFAFLSVAVLLIASVFCINTKAAVAEIIDSADITVNLNTDGTVDVTEKWIVSYVSSADYFYRDIDIYSSDNTMTLLQKFDSVSDVSVKINGTEASTSGVNSFAVTADEKSCEIAIYCPSAQVIRQYEISYTLEGALKKTKGNAVFDFMVIGKEFRYTSNNVTVTVNLPESADGAKIQLPEGYEGLIEGKSAVFASSRVYDTFAVSVAYDKDIFDDGALVSYSAAKASMAKFGSALLSALPYIIAVIAIIAIILFVLLPEKLMRFSAESRIKKRIKAQEENEAISLPEGISACEAYKLLVPKSRISPKSTSKKVPALFAMAVLECMEKGYIVPDDDKLIVGTPESGAPAYIMSVLNFLKTFSDKKGNRYVIDKEFADKVSAECMARYDVIANYLASFYELIPGADMKYLRKNKALYESAFAVKCNASHIKPKPTFAQCMGDVLSGASTADKDIFSFLLSSSSADKVFAKGGRTGEAALCEAVGAMYKVYIKSK